MSKTEDTPMKVLKTATCPTLSGKSTLTYQIGCSTDATIHLRISKNSGGGFFSDEWLALDDILETLKKRPEGSPVLSHFLTPLLKGKSVNTSAFILAAMTHLKLIGPLPKKKCVHELLDPTTFLEHVDKLISSGATSKATSRRSAKTVSQNTTSKKAAIKKKALSRKKTA